jgi:hypothetical protein
MLLSVRDRQIKKMAMSLVMRCKELISEPSVTRNLAFAFGNRSAPMGHCTGRRARLHPGQSRLVNLLYAFAVTKSAHRPIVRRPLIALAQGFARSARRGLRRSARRAVRRAAREGFLQKVRRVYARRAFSWALFADYSPRKGDSNSKPSSRIRRRRIPSTGLANEGKRRDPNQSRTPGEQILFSTDAFIWAE